MACGGSFQCPGDYFPAELRRKIVKISLLGYAGRTDFEIHLAGWLGRAKRRGSPRHAELTWIDPRLIECFYGAEENDSVCPRLGGGGAEAIRSGHPFDGGYTQLAQRIADGPAARA